MEFWLEPQYGTAARHTVLRIQQYPDTIGVTLETHETAPTLYQIQHLWEVALRPIDGNIIQRLLYESLAHIGHIDAVAYDCSQSDVDCYWYAALAVCQSIADKTESHTLSVVLCMNPLDLSSAAAEYAVRQQAILHAQSGIRINIIYGPAQDCITKIPVVQFLLHPHSRFMTGSVFNSDGKILLGGMLNAERILAQRAIPRANAR
jgi:hypothetical protein